MHDRINHARVSVVLGHNAIKPVLSVPFQNLGLSIGLQTERATLYKPVLLEFVHHHCCVGCGSTKRIPGIRIRGIEKAARINQDVLSS